MTIIRVTDGDIVAYFRCDLTQASSPVQQWDCEAEKWVGTQYQCADCHHRVGGLAELARVTCAQWAEEPADGYTVDWEQVTGFNEDPDTSHKDARDWYDSYGWHLSTEHAGDVLLQAVEYDWLDDEDNDTVAGRLQASDDQLTEDEALSIVNRAREVRSAGESVETLLTQAVEAYEQGDYEKCVKALDDCKAIEIEHGDCPASGSLRGQLLDESVAEIMAN